MQRTVDPNYSFKSLFIFLLSFFAPLSIFQIDGYSFFFVLLVLFFIVDIFFFQKSKLLIDRLFLFFVILLLITTILSFSYSIGRSWERRSLKGFVTIFLIGIVYFSIGGSQDVGKYLRIFKKGLLLAINVNLFWSLLQIVTYQLFSIDINTAIFVNFFHMVSTGSAFRGGELVATGLHWHPGNLAPLLVIALFVDDRLWHRVIVILVAVLTYNTTCILGVTLGVIILFTHLFLFNKEDKKRNTSSFEKLANITITLLVSILLILGLNHLNMFDQLSNIVSGVTNKFTFATNDSSANVHLRYYQILPNILYRIPLSKLFFGYGYGCSGYIYSTILGQYSFLSSWAVESDIVNNVLGLGIFNTLVIYTWIFRIGKSGSRIDMKYLSLVIILIIQGITYNVQFDWIILLLCMLLIFIKNNLNFFRSSLSV